MLVESGSFEKLPRFQKMGQVEQVVIDLNGACPNSMCYKPKTVMIYKKLNETNMPDFFQKFLGKQTHN